MAIPDCRPLGFHHISIFSLWVDRVLVEKYSLSKSNISAVGHISTFLISINPEKVGTSYLISTNIIFPYFAEGIFLPYFGRKAIFQFFKISINPEKVGTRYPISTNINFQNISAVGHISTIFLLYF